MERTTSLKHAICGAVAISALAWGPAFATDRTSDATAPAAVSGNTNELSDANETLREAKDVVAQMKKDHDLFQQVKEAKGILILPDFGRAAIVAGVRGGSGVLLAHREADWSDPVFYDMGGVSVGAQGGASAGSIVMLLMTDKAVDNFMEEDTWSLNADAGLSIINWSANAQASAGKDDIILWSDTEGLFAGAAISVTEVDLDEDEVAAFYGKSLSPRQVVAQTTQSGKAESLKRALP